MDCGLWTVDCGLRTADHGLRTGYKTRTYLFYFYFICHTIITKNIGKEQKKKWRGNLTETIGAYERLGLLQL